MSTLVTLQLKNPHAVASALHRKGYEDVATQIVKQLERRDAEIRKFAEVIETDLYNWSPEELRDMLHEFAVNILATLPGLRRAESTDGGAR